MKALKYYQFEFCPLFRIFTKKETKKEKQQYIAVCYSKDVHRNKH